MNIFEELAQKCSESKSNSWDLDRAIALCAAALKARSFLAEKSA